jgi:hypothetical protein
LSFRFRNNTKFAILAVSGINSSLPETEYQLSDQTWVLPALPALEDLGYWLGRLGSARGDSLQRTNLALLIAEDSPNALILDDVHHRLGAALNRLFFCLHLRPGIECFGSQEAELLLGSCADGNPIIRSVAPLPAFYQSKGYAPATVTAEWLAEALAIRSGLEQTEGSPADFARVRRGTEALVKALRSTRQDRLHELVRSLEAVVLPERGRTERQFAHRCQTFAVANEATRTALEEILGMRGDAEHLHDWDRAVAIHPADIRDDVCWQRTRQAERLARATYTRLWLDDFVRTHFRTDAEMDAFWKLTDDQRRSIWGPGVDIAAEPLHTQYDGWGRVATPLEASAVADVHV